MVMEMVSPSVRALVHQNDYGKFQIEPLERGYGTTLGNALRRVSISSLTGAAVTAVRIEGVLHEFGPIPGVKEDVIQFLMNLKNLFPRVEWKGAPPVDPYVLRLQAKGTGRVTAADIQCPADIEIANPELYLATISDPNASLNVEIFIEIGRGYVPANKMDRFRGQIGIIHVNALFSPVRKVNYIVEATLVGERTDYDRLVLEVWTNGTVAPGEAIARAAHLLHQQFSLFTHVEEFVEETTLAAVRPAVSNLRMDVPDKRIEELSFSSRTLNCLRRENIHTLRELATYTSDQLMHIKNFGAKALDEVKQKLSEFGISLAGTKHSHDAEEEEED
jgi:DNA-directed RNA polymerase subunit alpha